MFEIVQVWLAPIIQIVGLGVLWRAAYLLGKIQNSLEILKETSNLHDEKIDKLETGMAELKGRVYAKV